MTIKRILSRCVTNIYLCTDKRLKLYFLKSLYKLSFLRGKWNWIFIGYTVCGNPHFPAKSCCISVNVEVSFLSRCSKVFLVSAFSCKRMRISSSTSRTWKELSRQWEQENFFYQASEKAITRGFQLMTLLQTWHRFLENRLVLIQAPVVQTLKSVSTGWIAIQRITIRESICVIQWIETYSVDSTFWTTGARIKHRLIA